MAGISLSSLALESTQPTEHGDDARLARDMIAVHGIEAPAVARGNARSAALAGQGARARSWIKVLAIIQRHQKTPPTQGPISALPSLHDPHSTQG
jgi:hypothetical protein